MITLLTDFGLEDIYVGVMKGVVRGIAPQTDIIDLNHNIPPQDIHTASFQLACAHPYFPNGTIHTAVIDPGVGSSRGAIAIQTDTSFLVGPNNGLFSHVLTKTPAKKVIELNNPEFWLTSNPSQTFHGRDIFSPAAAHLSNGIDIEELGTEINENQLQDLPIGEPYSETQQTGQIQAIDHFGNLITTIPGKVIQNQSSSSWSLVLNEQSSSGQSTYSNVSVGKAIALIGSHGYLEIAVNQGNAQQFFQASISDTVKLIFHD